MLEKINDYFPIYHIYHKIIIMKFGEFVVDLFKDERGNISIKPVVGFMCSISLCIILFINCYNSKLTISDTIINSILLLAIVGIGADSVDKFSLKTIGQNIIPKKDILADKTATVSDKSEDSENK
jgi:hypothetical protein